MESENLSGESSFEDGFLGASIEVEDRSFGPTYPVAQWVNGSAKFKKQGGVAFTGGVFISADQGISGEKLAAAGFEPYSIVTSDGSEIAGFAATELTVSPIRYRRCWQVLSDNQLPQRFGWDEFDAAQAAGQPRGVAHLLLAVQGLDEPILLSFRGMTARRVMGQGKDRGIIPQYGQKIIAAAKRAARAAHKDNNYPLCAFRLTIAPDSDGKNPKFTEVGKGDKKNSVTYPVWRDEPAGEVDMATLQRLFVGSERFAQYQDWHKSADEWVAAWDTEALAGFRNRRRGAAAGGEEAVADGTPGDQQVVF